MRCVRILACGLAVVLGAVSVLDVEAAGPPRDAAARLIELPFLFAAPDDGTVVLIAAPEVGATEMRFRESVVVVPVAGGRMRFRGPFSISAGTDHLTISMGARMSEFGAPLFVTAVFLPADPEAAPYVIAAPMLAPFPTDGEVALPDQEDSPGLTYQGRGVDVFAGRSDDESNSAASALRRSDRRRRGERN